MSDRCPLGYLYYLLTSFFWGLCLQIKEPEHDKTNRMTSSAPSKDSDQPRRVPSLIRVVVVPFMGSKGPKPSSDRQGTPWSDWVNAQVDLNFCWAYMPFCWFCCAFTRLYFGQPILQCTHDSCHNLLKKFHAHYPYGLDYLLTSFYRSLCPQIKLIR